MTEYPRADRSAQTVTEYRYTVDRGSLTLTRSEQPDYRHEVYVHSVTDEKMVVAESFANMPITLRAKLVVSYVKIAPALAARADFACPQPSGTQR